MMNTSVNTAKKKDSFKYRPHWFRFKMESYYCNGDFLFHNYNRYSEIKAKMHETEEPTLQELAKWASASSLKQQSSTVYWIKKKSYFAK